VKITPCYEPCMSLVRALACLALLASCDRTIAGGRADGAAVFADACVRCHGDGGRPPETLQRQLGVRDLTSAEFRARATAASIADQIRRGSANKIMPGFAGQLTDAQIDAVTTYVLELSAPP
jgi:mono/diheme cytochrome c family protein